MNANELIKDFQNLAIKVMKYKGGCDKCINGAEYKTAFDLLNTFKKETGGCGCNANQNGGKIIKKKINTRRKKENTR